MSQTLLQLNLQVKRAERHHLRKRLLIVITLWRPRVTTSGRLRAKLRARTPTPKRAPSPLMPKWCAFLTLLSIRHTIKF